MDSKWQLSVLTYGVKYSMKPGNQIKHHISKKLIPTTHNIVNLSKFNAKKEKWILDRQKINQKAP